MEAIGLIQERLHWCESRGVGILCCPEAVLGGLADNAPRPADFALDAGSGQLSDALAPLSSVRVTTIVGLTEIAGDGKLYNSAAVFHKGAVIGIYRKLHPAIRKSVYQAGDQVPVFRVDGLTFGVIICNDSNFAEPARLMAAQGATVLFVPTNTGLPPSRADVSLEARARDIALAKENGMWVVRADIAGRTADLVAYGSTGVTDPTGTIRQSAHRLVEDLLVVDLADPI